MQTDTQLTNEIKNTLKQMSKAYANRDIDLMRDVTHADAFVLGTGQDEVARGIDKVLAMPVRDWSQADSTRIEFSNLHVYGSGTVAWCDAESTFSVKAGGQNLVIPARFTGVFRRVRGQWLMIQGHFSVPAANQPTGASFPTSKRVLTH